MDADHIHEWVRCTVYIRHGTTTFKRDWRWKCNHPDCHTVSKRYQVKGKRSICAICHKNTLVLDNEALKRAYPRCVNCSNSKEDIRKREIKLDADILIGNLLDAPPEEKKQEVVEEVHERTIEEDLLSGMYKED